MTQPQLTWIALFLWLNRPDRVGSRYSHLMARALDSRFHSENDSPGFLLWRVTNRWQSDIRAALRPFDLTHVQFVLLAALTWAADEDGITQIELANRIRSDPMMISQVLRALEKKGLVRRLRHPDDGRAFRVSVTAEGAALASRANAAVEAADAAFFGEDSSHRKTLTAHLAGLDQRNR